MQPGERFDEALAYASRLHARQARKGAGGPYIGHLLAVTAIVLEHGGDEDEAIAALLHDAVEDQGGRPRLEEIRGRFGDAVADIVDGCTDAYTVPKSPWRERKEAYLAASTGGQPLGATRIGGRQAAQRPLSRRRLSRQRRRHLAALQRRPRGYALVLPRGSPAARQTRRHAAGRTARTGHRRARTLGPRRWHVGLAVFIP